jgi:hypothetical protein
MSNTTRSISITILVFIILTLFVTACSPKDNEYTQQLESQINALETQNALLIENQNQAVNLSNATSDVPLPPAESNSNPVMVSTPTLEALPTTPVAAGIPVIYQGWALTMSPELKTGKWNGDEYFAISFTLRNLGEQSRVFRYVKSGVSVVDNLGNSYEFSLSDENCKSSPDHIHLPQQITIEAGDSINIEGSDWLGCWENDNIPPIKGVLPVSASQIIVTITDWGPFNGVTYYLDL